jgi:hypothetical protein
MTRRRAAAATVLLLAVAGLACASGDRRATSPPQVEVAETVRLAEEPLDTGELHEDGRMVPVPWALPPVDSCRPEGGLKGWPPGMDAPPIPFDPGDDFGIEQLEVLRSFLPPFIWEYRDRFFHEGMRLVIGRCFTDYSPPAFFRAATAKHAGEARLTEENGLVDYSAGLPFAPERLEPDDPWVGLKWAWNFEMRYQGAGFWGDFRTTDMVRKGQAEPFVGEVFRAQTSFRSDRPDDGYKAPGGRDKHWVAGGLLHEPFDAREYAWRQYRSVDHMTEPDRSDDLHAYLPDFRRVRRVPATGVEGLYMPSFSVGVVKPTSVSGLGGFSGSAGGAAGAVSGMGTTITTKRSGFEGLEMRPLLYDMELIGVQDVLTPINADRPSYPADEERDFGPWGLSFGSDRWDLRRALVLQGLTRGPSGGDQVARFIVYVDVQSLAPLYYASWDSREEQIDVGMHAGRWSEERDVYRRWPGDDGRAIRVIDPVGASYANILEDGGWRRESWEIVSTPPPDRAFKRQLSINNLTKRR